MTRETYEKARDKALALYEKAHIILTDEEKATLEVADFGLNDLENTGLEIVTYINTDRYCAKEMALFPRQTCPEHSHVPFGDYIGKQETFRVRYGVVYLYVDGEPRSIHRRMLPMGHTRLAMKSCFAQVISTRWPLEPSIGSKRGRMER